MRCEVHWKHSTKVIRQKSVYTVTKGMLGSIKHSTDRILLPEDESTVWFLCQEKRKLYYTSSLLLTNPNLRLSSSRNSVSRRCNYNTSMNKTAPMPRISVPDFNVETQATPHFCRSFPVGNNSKRFYLTLKPSKEKIRLRPNVVDELLKLLLRIWKVPCSHLGPETGYPE